MDHSPVEYGDIADVAPLSLRVVLSAAFMAVATIIATPSITAAATSSPAQTGLRLSVSPTAGGGVVTVIPVDPCPPPAAATQPVAMVGSTSLAGDQVIAGPSVTVPVAADGRWSASLTLSGAGHHQIGASCLSSPQAEGSYATYQPADAAVLTRSVGYWVAGAQVSAADGFGDAFAAPATLPISDRPVVGIAAEPPTGLGYWTVAADGGVFTFGDAPFHGSAAPIPLAAPVVAIAATNDGGGYWLLGRDGGVFTFGNAPFFGAGVGEDPVSPAVGIAPTGRHTRLGYLVAHADGSVYLHTAGGSAQVAAPIAGLAAPVIGIASTPSQAGWYLGAADGGVFTFGDARFGGSAAALHLVAPVTGIAVRNDGGYWLVGADEGIFSFCGAPFFGTRAGTAHAGFGPAVGLAATPDALATPQ
jgi:hypothetical protein